MKMKMKTFLVLACQANRYINGSIIFLSLKHFLIMPYDINELFPDQIFKEWDASETFGDGRALVCGADWNQQKSSWSHSKKRGGFGLQAGEGGDILGNLPLGQPGDVVDDGWMMGEPVQEEQKHWDTNFFGQPETCRRQPVTRFVAFAFAFEIFCKGSLLYFLKSR